MRVAATSYLAPQYAAMLAISAAAELELALVLDLAGDDVADQALQRGRIFAFPVVGVVTLRALALRSAAAGLHVRRVCSAARAEQCGDDQ